MSETTELATRPTISSDPYRGLIWAEETFGPEAQWTYEPEISAIERTIQSLRPSNTTQVRFLAEGAFNKIYHVQLDDETLIMRVSLPVHPVYKTRSEVATVDWIRHVTDIPTPRIIAYNDTRESEIGFEWILMTEVPGKPLADLWQCLSIAAKSDLVKKFAGFSISLWRNQLKGIGNIYPPSVTANEKASAGDPAASGSPEHLVNAVPKTGQIVSLEFLWGSHARRNVNRGPFLSSQDWMEARLAFAKNDCQEILAKYPAGDDLDSDAEDELEATTRTLALIEKLEKIFPRVFPLDKYVPEPSVVFHDDLSQHNILVSEKGELTGVLDWECVSALPLWKACYYPTFLYGRPRDTKPNIEMYDRGNPPPGSAFWEHLHDYEVTLLRGVFLDEMRKSEPGWVNIFDMSHLRRDFDTAVQYFDNGIVRHIIEKWVEDVTAGNENPQSLRDSLGC
ncbi:Aminoglycoside phosphotransferase [Penicillium expansum]|nr:Aminoglycoside phosphotransferase [Penicillium expansum]